MKAKIHINQPLSCGATVWIEAEYEDLKLTQED